MALKIIRGEPAETGGLVADRRLYLAREQETSIDAAPGRRLVEEGSPEAAFLLASPGTLISAAEVARLGLTVVDGKIVQVTAEPPAATEPGTPPCPVVPNSAEPPAAGDIASQPRTALTDEG